MKYGISNISIVPMRKEDCDKSEMVNQVLFGEHFKVSEIRKKFSRIILSHDKYEGWICNKQWIQISEDNYNELDKEIFSSWKETFWFLGHVEKNKTGKGKLIYH